MDVIRLAWGASSVWEKGDPPPPGAYPVYGSTAKGPPSVSAAAGARDFVTANVVRQGGMTPSVHDHLGAESRPIGSLVITERTQDRVKGRMEFAHSVVAPPQTECAEIQVEGAFDARRVPRADALQGNGHMRAGPVKRRGAGSFSPSQEQEENARGVYMPGPRCSRR